MMRLPNIGKRLQRQSSALCLLFSRGGYPRDKEDMEIGTNRQKDSSSPYKCGLRLMHDLLLSLYMKLGNLQA